MIRTTRENDKVKDVSSLNAKYYDTKNKIVASIGKYYTYSCIFFSIMIITFLTYFIASKGLSTFLKDGVSLFDFLLGTEWKPEHENTPKFGAFAFIFGSFAVTLLSVSLSTPLSVGAAIFMAEISPKSGSRFLQPVIELLVGIPSVVYGFIGLSVIVPFMRNTFGGTGFCLASGTLVLTIMILPTITSVSYDSLKALPGGLKDASYALGATRWQTIYRVLIPTALPSILTGVVLGMARAFGEALAVQMVIGNVQRLPNSIFDSISTLTSILTLEMSNTIAGTTYNNALWSMALILLLMSFIFIFIIRILGKGSKLNER
ncbi:MAG: phosphate transport system permease protein [Clostridiales bacterium]|nr:phosphate ABC transporter permease subunit PstC [Petroclostridium xylanilyticum]MBZ4645724.1 phosphate transporter permease subunit PstC [Clostridia bacterium]MDK2809682.1 phosphate transport system permease protein [Petroclostridium sp.]MDK2932675.1 phosphate transport system permease protein [Clostridiales bacterium]